jgi:hypothetical protein
VRACRHCVLHCCGISSELRAIVGGGCREPYREVLRRIEARMSATKAAAVAALAALSQSGTNSYVAAPPGALDAAVPYPDSASLRADLMVGQRQALVLWPLRCAHVLF